MHNQQHWLPHNDGVDHINVYTKGATLLGRLASNLSAIPFTHPVHGNFACMEGWWYYVATGMKHEHLRNLTGFAAKNEGKQLPQVHNKNFRELIKEGLRLKVMQSVTLKTELMKSSLPLAHYYVYNNTPKYQDNHYWQIEYLEQLRTELQMGCGT